MRIREIVMICKECRRESMVDVSKLTLEQIAEKQRLFLCKRCRVTDQDDVLAMEMEGLR